MIKTKHWYSYTTYAHSGSVRAMNMNDAVKKVIKNIIGKGYKSDTVFRLDFLVKKGKNKF